MQIQVKCLQTMQLIFRHDSKRVTVPYIHALAPRVVESLIRETTQPMANISTDTYDVIMNQLIVLEILIEMAEAGKSECDCL